jgi:hypothetical protein
MSILLKRIEQSFGLVISGSLDHAQIAVNIWELPKQSRTDLVRHYAQINIEYNVLCSQIAIELTAGESATKLRTQIEEALRIAELLETLYKSYLDIPRELHRVQKEQRLLRLWLALSPKQIDTALSPVYTSKLIRESTSNLNLYRLFSVRLRRLLMAITPLTNTTSTYYRSMKQVDKFAGPFFSHLAWLYFIPRISINLAMCFKHTFEHNDMSNEEKGIDWTTRLKIQLFARWPDLLNDIPWLIANAVSCFLFIGAYAPYGIVLSICMQFYEVAQAVGQHYIEIQHLQEQCAEYANLRDACEKNSEEYKNFDTFIKHFEQRIDYESKRLLIPIVNASVLLVAIIFAAPVFSPGFAVAGGVIAVLITIISYLAKKELEKHKPASNLFQLIEKSSPNSALPSQTGLFSKTSTEPDVAIDTSIAVSKR